MSHKTVTIALGLFLVTNAQPIVAPAGDEPVLYYAKFESTAEGKKFTSTITSEVLERTPSWTKGNDFPPLSPRVAVTKAEKLFNKLLRNQECWEVKEISLMFAYGEKWFWVIRYNQKVKPKEGKGPPFFVVVLMDGRVITPEIMAVR